MELGEGVGEECLEQYRIDYAEKRKVDNRERVHRCRDRKALSRESEAWSLECEVSKTVATMETLRCIYFVDCNRSLHRVSARLARELAEEVSTYLCKYNPVVQLLTIEKFLGQKSLVGMLPPFLVNSNKIKLRHSVLGNLKGDMIDHLIGVKQFKIVMAKDIVCTLTSSSNMGSNRGVANLIGVDRRNLRRGMERRLLLDTQQNAFWLKDRCTSWSDTLSDLVKTMVINF